MIEEIDYMALLVIDWELLKVFLEAHVLFQWPNLNTILQKQIDLIRKLIVSNLSFPSLSAILKEMLLSFSGLTSVLIGGRTSIGWSVVGRAFITACDRSKWQLQGRRVTKDMVEYEEFKWDLPSVVEWVAEGGEEANEVTDRTPTDVPAFAPSPALKSIPTLWQVLNKDKCKPGEPEN
ncbi:hypothetical protein FSARC_10413 [Fusarium sarcochroum]|uniref:Uncharacterized protein n=1 Tax=Fusarium sarcochroum TaxID=1208366 RepID=A0A8H4TMK1_9HYPO|nr:hypothetical protein FSARC_10413 [Fusarium sarcochroum]